MLGKMSKTIGVITSSASIVLWCVWVALIFDLPGFEISFLFTIMFTILMPAIVALFAAIYNSVRWLWIASLWSFPISLYTFGGEGLVQWFIVTCLGYFVAAIMGSINQRKEKTFNR